MLSYPYSAPAGGIVLRFLKIVGEFLDMGFNFIYFKGYKEESVDEGEN
jgi:hypothetical protein